ncbi:MAG: acyP [Verrucomicrobiaceae bacterium]|nr:acyP [Verrucomicrobiaceae bacterium]
MPQTMTARQVIYSGRVQGVGFRAAIKYLAAGYEVTGWVKNLDDGRVELQAMAADGDELEAFLKGVDESDLAGYIKEREVHIMQPLTGIRGFSIVR